MPEYPRTVAEQMEDEQATERLGTVLRGKYRLDRVLGVGGMGVVYAATHRNQKQFAIKVLHRELSVRDDIRARFLREGYAANSVNHPGVVTVLDDDTTEDGLAFLVMELLEGASVETLWEGARRRLPVLATLALAYELLDVLAASHAKGIVHRDIKPANLFLTREGQIKVLDFGIARVRDAAASPSDATATGVLLGTPAFIAPEQALGRADRIDARTDIWAAGATLFALLGGRYVHEGETGQEVLIRAATTQAPSPASLAPDLPPSVVAIVDRSLAFAIEDRWPSAQSMRDAVRDAYLMVCGRMVSRDSLIVLFDNPDPRIAPTQLAETDAGRQTRPARSAELPAPIAPTVDQSVARVGATTAQPVSNGLEALNPAGVPRRRAVVLGAVFIVMLFVGGGMAALVLTLKKTANGDATASPSVSPSTPAARRLEASVPTVGRAASSPPEHEVASASVSSLPTRTPVPRASPSVAATVTAPPVIPPATAPMPNCKPPFFFDSEGNKVFKRECL